MACDDYRVGSQGGDAPQSIPARLISALEGMEFEMGTSGVARYGYQGGVYGGGGIAQRWVPAEGARDLGELY